MRFRDSRATCFHVLCGLVEDFSLQSGPQNQDARQSEKFLQVLCSIRLPDPVLSRFASPKCFQEPHGPFSITSVRPSGKHYEPLRKRSTSLSFAATSFSPAVCLALLGSDPRPSGSTWSNVGAEVVPSPYWYKPQNSICN